MLFGASEALFLRMKSMDANVAGACFDANGGSATPDFASDVMAIR